MKVKENNKCDFCPDEIDFNEHFFFECKRVQPLWKNIENKIAAECGKRIVFTSTTVLFGIVDDTLPKKDLMYINHLILIAKMSISSFRKAQLQNLLQIIFDVNVKLRLK